MLFIIEKLSFWKNKEIDYSKLDVESIKSAQGLEEDELEITFNKLEIVLAKLYIYINGYNPKRVNYLLDIQCLKELSFGKGIENCHYWSS